ncbi:MAG: hypothetical protein H6R04_908 [Burkholderiaceae bacterium]|nr:hypothetical protein [Burkholderiaceae bacterium]
MHTALISPRLHDADGCHPNELDLRRIAHMLEKRTRYRYVPVEVVPATNGYRIVSPCCSRTVDPNGGKIDIALIEFDQQSNKWKLFNKLHERNIWLLHLCADRLQQLLDCLNEDPARLFWQ